MKGFFKRKVLSVKDSFLRIMLPSIRLQVGFTIIELLVVIGIIATLFGLATINLVKTQHNANVNAAVDQLLSDIKVQQTRAMTGAEDKNNKGNSYGIHFTGSSYILFQGTSYNISDTTNFPVSPDATSFSNTLPAAMNNSIVFNQLSGEINGFVAGKNTIVVTNSAGSESRTITINQYGIVTNVQAN